jgi:hypothetical protein
VQADASLSVDTPVISVSGTGLPAGGGLTEAIFLDYSQRTQVSKSNWTELKSRLSLAKQALKF